MNNYKNYVALGFDILSLVTAGYAGYRVFRGNKPAQVNANISFDIPVDEILDEDEMYEEDDD